MITPKTLLILSMFLTLGCNGGGRPDSGSGGTSEETANPAAGSDAYVRPSAQGGELVQGDTVPGLPAWTRQDWEVLRRTASWAWESGVAALPIGDRIARIGETFIGTPYIPQTLEPPGPERLIVNLRAYDCVTYVENMLALAHFVASAERDILDQPEQAMRSYQEILTRIRYRGGRLDGYGSRLHYFAEWIGDNEAKGLVRNVTGELGGVIDPEPITFMTAHRDAYRQLADPAAFARIEEVEGRLRSERRFYIPEDRVDGVAERIADGDILALTSTLAGLDVAHTGIALWRDGALHLMNAPLVGKSVEVSEAPLAVRLLRIESQDGLMVARPLNTPAAPQGR